mmetsp:Transcript_13846/g.22621  ORF Transcript_13846/g.22621 Transcript_13846/m.22621 type:complete len:243 (+) Transcript_13846:124-852(+)
MALQNPSLNGRLPAKISYFNCTWNARKFPDLAKFNSAVSSSNCSMSPSRVSHSNFIFSGMRPSRRERVSLSLATVCTFASVDSGTQVRLVAKNTWSFGRYFTFLTTRSNEAPASARSSACSFALSLGRARRRGAGAGALLLASCVARLVLEIDSFVVPEFSGRSALLPGAPAVSCLFPCFSSSPFSLPFRGAGEGDDRNKTWADGSTPISSSTASLRSATVAPGSSVIFVRSPEASRTNTWY